MALYRCGGGSDELYSLAKSKVMSNSYTVPTIYGNRISISQGGYFVEDKTCYVYIKGTWLIGDKGGNYPNVGSWLITENMPDVYTYTDNDGIIILTSDMQMRPYLQDIMVSMVKLQTARKSGINIYIFTNTGDISSSPIKIPNGYNFEIYGKYAIAR